MKDTSIKTNRLPEFIIFGIVSIFSMIYLKSILAPIFISILLAVIVRPIVDFLIKKKVPQTLSVFISIVTIIAVFGTFVYVILLEFGDLADKQTQIMQKFTDYKESIFASIKQTRNGEKLLGMIKGNLNLEGYMSSGLEKLMGTLNTSVDFFISLTLLPIYMFFFLMHPDFFFNAVSRIVDPNDKFEIKEIISACRKSLQSYFVGFFKVILILTILNSIGLLALGIENAIFYSALASLLNIVPYVGVLVGSLLPAFIALITKDSAWYAVGVIGWMSFVQFLEGNIITPKIVGDEIKINSFIVLVFLLLAGKIWGIVGLVVAIPIAAVLKEICKNIPKLQHYAYLIGEFPEKNKKKSKSKSIIEKLKLSIS
jgi:predicted PurR-regulated permease PerM